MQYKQQGFQVQLPLDQNPRFVNQQNQQCAISKIQEVGTFQIIINQIPQLLCYYSYYQVNIFIPPPQHQFSHIIKLCYNTKNKGCYYTHIPQTMLKINKQIQYTCYLHILSKYIYGQTICTSSRIKISNTQPN